jgi:hypothetical protein
MFSTLPGFPNRRALALWTLGLVAIFPTTSYAQTQQTLLTTGVVGGVAIDPTGMLKALTQAERASLQQEIVRQLQAIPEGMQAKTELRKVSLARLEAALGRQAAGGEPIPDALQCLGGLQRVRYVLVYPDQHDIVLVGPGEGWKVNSQGAVVGVDSGQPPLLLDDLLIALRALNNPRPNVISCSIDPSQEGRARLQGFVRQLRTIGNPAHTAQGIEAQLGPQEISITGVPATSHFARVMVAADYRMKRIGMGLEPAPVRGLPSFLQMAKAGSRGLSNMMPRWWLEPDYQPLASDAQELAWEIRGAQVKTLTENDYLAANGAREQSGKADPLSQKWADLMTRSYDQLAQAEPVFIELRNCMDLAVVAALIVTKDLPAKAGCQLPLLLGKQPTAELPAPKQVASKAAVMPKGRVWMIACGGVQINPWEAMKKIERNESLASLRNQASMGNSANWWSN